MYLILLSHRQQKSAAGSSRLLSSLSIQTCQQTFSVLVLRSPLQSGLKTVHPPALQLCMFNSAASKLLQMSCKLLLLLLRRECPSSVSFFGREWCPSDLLSTLWCLVFPSIPIVGSQAKTALLRSGVVTALLYQELHLPLQQGGNSAGISAAFLESFSDTEL